MPMPQPLKIKSQLHDNPSGAPQWAQDVKIASGETLALPCPVATRAMVALMDMEAVIGGAASHFGGPAAFAEMMSSVHGLMYHQAKAAGKPWHELFHFVNDAGHCENGLYALKANYGVAGQSLETLKKFRSIESGLTGHGEAHLFPEGVYVSNGPLGSGLPQAQGLAVAESLTQNPRVTVTAISDGACMEGEAREALAAIPGFAKKNQLGPFVCMVSDNNTKLSGRIDEDSFSMNPTFSSLVQLGWNVVEIKDGHDLQKVTAATEQALQAAKQDPSRPQLLWFKTVKGKGVQKTESSSSGGHGFPIKDPKDIGTFVKEIFGSSEIPQPIAAWVKDLEERPSKEKSTAKVLPGDRMKVQVGVSNALTKMYQKGLPIISVSADLQGSTGLAPFRKQFPEAAYEVGVAESNMVSMAVGLSKQGYIPVVDTFAQFAVTKGALPLIMSGLSQGPIIGILSHTGFQDAADGASHQALTYMAMTAAIPYVDVYVLSCRDEAEALVSQSIERFAEDRKQGKVPRSQIFFLGRENYLAEYGEAVDYKLGHAQVISEKLEGFDKKVSLLAAGPMLESALLAQDALAEQGVGSVVVHPSVINAPDLKTLKSCLDKTDGYCVTIEDHRVVGGFGSLAIHALVNDGYNVKAKSMGVGDHFGRSAYSAQALYDNYGLGVSHLIETAKALVSP